MTLTTHVRFTGEPPIALHEFFLLARQVANIPAEWPFTKTHTAIVHEPGCPGVKCRVDAYTTTGSVSFDTPYSYMDDSGFGCDEIHATLVDSLMTRAEREGWRLEWLNEFQGTWHTHRPIRTVLMPCCGGDPSQDTSPRDIVLAVERELGPGVGRWIS